MTLVAITVVGLKDEGIAWVSYVLRDLPDVGFAHNLDCIEITGFFRRCPEGALLLWSALQGTPMKTGLLVLRLVCREDSTHVP